MKEQLTVFWFRRDLRLTDNAGLYHALKGPHPVLPLFIFDTVILDKLDNKEDARVAFIHESLLNMQEQLVQKGTTFHVFYGAPKNVFIELIEKYTIASVFTNHDYEPDAIERDKQIAALLQENNISFYSFKDQVIFEKDDVIKDNGKPYTVFTPYSRKWKSKLNESHLPPYPAEKYAGNFYKQAAKEILPLEQIGFKKAKTEFPAPAVPDELLTHYAKQRDIPGIKGTSRLGIHLRFGTISIRLLAAKALPLSEPYLNELIWRDFYQMILWHFPDVGKGSSFKPAYDHIEWRRDKGEFEKWCKGETGYPIVDAGMRELNATGFMHNRVRMITASFLCKHLLLDWRLGEAYFAEKLLDFDLASNNGGWQWAAGCGCDAAPYFRIFNPYLQTKKFDPEFLYIKKWVPEFQEFSYPAPIVEHEFARKRCLEVYAKAIKKVNQ